MKDNTTTIKHEPLNLTSNYPVDSLGYISMLKSDTLKDLAETLEILQRISDNSSALNVYRAADGIAEKVMAKMNELLSA